MRAYRLDASDVLRSVRGDWDRFAAANAGAGAMSSQVVGRVLWDMLQGSSTTGFLDRLFYDCRQRQTALGLLYRCDSPMVERLFFMRVAPLEGGWLEVSHRLIRSRPLPFLPVLDLSHRQFRRCSQCLSCNFGGPWVEAAHINLPAGAVALDAICPVCRSAAFLAQGGPQMARPSLCG